MYWTAQDLRRALQDVAGDTRLRVAYNPHRPTAAFVENVAIVEHDLDRYGGNGRRHHGGFGEPRDIGVHHNGFEQVLWIATSEALSPEGLYGKPTVEMWDPELATTHQPGLWVVKTEARRRGVAPGPDGAEGNGDQ